MNNFTPQIGSHFIHIPNNSQPRNLIYTKSGYLPNDIKAERRIWESGIHCGSGMNECMTPKQFSMWWASIIEFKYKHSMSKKKKVPMQKA